MSRSEMKKIKILLVLINVETEEKDILSADIFGKILVF